MFKMKTLYFLRGLPASGKTTWARAKLDELNLCGKIMAVRTNKDEIRIEFGETIESGVIRREVWLVTEALNAGLDVIIDNTHFNPHHERRYRLLAKKYGYSFDLKSFMHVPLEECIRRDQNRANSVGEPVIRLMYARYLAPTPESHAITRGLLLQWPR